MPRYTQRQQQVQHLIKGFRTFVILRAARRKRRAARDKHFRRRSQLPRPGDHTAILNHNTDLDDLFDTASMDISAAGIDEREDLASRSPTQSQSASVSESQESVSNSSTSSYSLHWESGSDNSEFHFYFSDSTNATSSDLDSGSESSNESEVPDLADDDHESSSESNHLRSAEDEANFLDSDLEDGFNDQVTQRSTLSRLLKKIHHEIEELYATRYQASRTAFRKPPADLPHVLSVFKAERPDHFRKQLRVSPSAFDRIVEKIEDDPIFSNNSQNDQMPVEHQLAILLYRFGHFGNAASLDDVAKWAGYAKGTVILATRRVMTAILCPEFMDKAVSYPTAEEKEEAKVWIEKHSCYEWRDGWCMVDGTLVPFAER